MIRIAFWIGDKSNPRATAVDRLVAWWTGRGCDEKRFSHVALVESTIGGGSSLIDAHPKAGTVRMTHAYTGSPDWVTVEVAGNAKLAFEYAYRQVGRRYGYTEWLTFALGFRVTAGGVTCSQLVAESIGLHDAWAHSPNSLFVSCSRMQKFRVIPNDEIKNSIYNADGV